MNTASDITEPTPEPADAVESCHDLPADAGCAGEPTPGGGKRQAGRARSDDLLAAALAGGATVAAAAAAAKIGERTAYRRLQDEAFAARVRELRDAMVQRASGRLADAMGDAVDVLRALLKSEAEGIRLRAATALLAEGLRVGEFADQARRLEELERRLAGGGK